MRVAIHQPNYLPWCGFFAKMRACDVFVFLDDAAFSKGSYVPRTKVRTPDGDSWLTVPTKAHGGEPIRSVEIADGNWPTKHLRTLRQNYSKAQFGGEVLAVLQNHYAAAGDHLAVFNERLIRSVAEYLDLKVEFARSSEIQTGLTSDDRLVEIVRRVGGRTYISGAGGTKYQDPEKFTAAGLKLEVRRYHPVAYAADGFAFQPGLSIVDALFIKGRSAVDLLTYGDG